MKTMICAAILCGSAAIADPVKVVGTEFVQTGDSWRVSVTLEHPDSGWDHYADAWEILNSDGNSPGLRILAHPHVNEQPFTRSLSGVVIPAGVQTVYVRARCIVDGWNEDLTEVALN